MRQHQLQEGGSRKTASMTRVGEGTHVAGFREFTAGDERRWFFFATSGQAWRSGEWASDAAMVCFRRGPGNVKELILVGGSYIEYAGTKSA